MARRGGARRRDLLVGHRRRPGLGRRRQPVATALPAPNETSVPPAAPSSTRPDGHTDRGRLAVGTGQGGTVTAQCVNGRPHVVSAAPRQGFGVESDDSGDEVQFRSSDHRTEMKVTCSGLTATVHASSAPAAAVVAAAGRPRRRPGWRLRPGGGGGGGGGSVPGGRSGGTAEPPVGCGRPSLPRRSGGDGSVPTPRRTVPRPGRTVSRQRTARPGRPGRGSAGGRCRG